MDIATKLANAALRIVVESRRDRLQKADEAAIEAMSAAMKQAARKELDQMMDDIKAAPWVAQMAFQAAALGIAQAGLAALDACGV